jgi:hypothetical protein
MQHTQNDKLLSCRKAIGAAEKIENKKMPSPDNQEQLIEAMALAMRAKIFALFI